jgi:hypothetical protein
MTCQYTEQNERFISVTNAWAPLRSFVGNWSYAPVRVELDVSIAIELTTHRAARPGWKPDDLLPERRPMLAD